MNLILRRVLEWIGVARYLKPKLPNLQCRIAMALMDMGEVTGSRLSIKDAEPDNEMYCFVQFRLHLLQKVINYIFTQ